MEIKTGDDYVLYCIMWCDIMGGQIIFINRSGGRVPLVPPWDLHLWLSACTVAKKMLLCVSAATYSFHETVELLFNRDFICCVDEWGRPCHARGQEGGDLPR